MFPSSPRFRNGFTLVEMLTAMAIFVIMIAFLGQLISNTSVVTNASKGRLSADDQARFALDRIGEDFLQMSKRTDLDYLVDKDAGINDEIYFYSEVPGVAAGASTAASGVSLVGYGVNSDGKLVRYSESKIWSEVSFLTYKNPSPDPDPDSSSEIAKPGSTDEKFHVLCDGVFRFEITFLLRDGTYSDKPILDSSSKFLTDVHLVGQRKFSGDNRASTCVAVAADGTTPIWRGLGWKDVSAIIVSIAVIDDQSRKILNSGQLEGVAGRLDNGPGFSNLPPSLPLETWSKKVNQPDSLGIPMKAASGIRVYQRAFYLNAL